MEGLARGQDDQFFRALALLGPRLLLEPSVIEEVDKWWRQKNILKDEQAKHRLERIGTELATFGKGKDELSGEEKEAVVKSCKKWRPICKALNEAFKKLWGQEAYQASEHYRKEARGMLAEKLDIPFEDVQAIEAFLSNPSRRARKRTPHDAMLHRVAREFVGRGEKTVEKIWRDYLKAHPEEKRSRRVAT